MEAFINKNPWSGLRLLGSATSSMLGPHWVTLWTSCCCPLSETMQPLVHRTDAYYPYPGVPANDRWSGC